MLKTIIKLRNIGLFMRGMPVPTDFDLLTLLCAVKGRGKSKLETLLRLRPWRCRETAG